MQKLGYLGCKHSLLNYIQKVLKINVVNTHEYSFTDLFAGTGTVSFFMNDKYKSVISNDLEYYSYVINCALLKCKYTLKLENLINMCNKLKPIDGIIYNNFSPNENCERMYFTNENAKKIDAIRIFIEKLKKEHTINTNEYHFLIASLLISTDKIANVACVYAAYLKKFKKSALKELNLIPIHTNKSLQTKGNKVYNDLAENVSKNKKLDIIYLDPPYNARNYAGNYSQLNYIAKYDKDQEIIGKTGLIKGYNKSVFCSKVKAENSFEKLISNLDCKYILLSYNNEGILKQETLKKILLKKGNVVLYKIKYKKFKCNENNNASRITEFLFFVDTSKKENKFTETEIDKEYLDE
jgi:adenine-specific DNA-methyltransferase